MLISISSETFQWNDSRQTFELNSNIYILGYTQITIEQFSLKYTEFGRNFYFIKKFINQSTQNSETENEFCHALRCYLRYIQKTIALHDIEKYSLIKFAAQLDPILCSLE